MGLTSPVPIHSVKYGESTASFNEDLIKQVPLIQVLMSHQTDENYLCVLRKIKEILDSKRNI